MQIKDYVISSPKYDTYVKVFGELEGKTPLIILHGGPGGFMDSYDNLCLLSYFEVVK